MTKRKSTWGSMAAYTNDSYGTSTAGPRHAVAGSTQGSYSTAKHSPSTATRPGANAALQLPSRMGEHLIYRDGSTKPFTKPTTPSETNP